MSSARPFLDFLREQRGGVLHDDLSDALQECVAAVAQEGGVAKLTLTLLIKPADVGEGTISVKDEIKLALPKERKGATLFFVSPENNLIRDNPKQHRLPLTEVARRNMPDVADKVS